MLEAARLLGAELGALPLWEKFSQAPILLGVLAVPPEPEAGAHSQLRGLAAVPRLQHPAACLPPPGLTLPPDGPEAL